MRPATGSEDVAASRTCRSAASLSLAQKACPTVGLTSNAQSPRSARHKGPRATREIPVSPRGDAERDATRTPHKRPTHHRHEPPSHRAPQRRATQHHTPVGQRTAAQSRSRRSQARSKTHGPAQTRSKVRPNLAAGPTTLPRLGKPTVIVRQVSDLTHVEVDGTIADTAPQPDISQHRIEREWIAVRPSRKRPDAVWGGPLGVLDNELGDLIVAQPGRAYAVDSLREPRTARLEPLSKGTVQPI